MFLNERQIPEIVLEIDAILNRLPPYHPKRSWLEDDRKNYMRGFFGEKQIDWHLKNLDNDNFFIICGLRLEFQNQTFQIDTLILSRQFLLIIESKNIAGTLFFEKDSTQLIRQMEGKEQGFKNPIIQVERQKRLLIGWLKKHKIPPIPVVDLVGIADRRTVIKTSEDNRQIFQKLIHADVLVEKIKQLGEQHNEGISNTRQIHKLNLILMKEHTPALPSILKKYQIDISELYKGIQCPYCKQYPLTRQTQKWFCYHCKAYSKGSHIKAVIDYFLIISPTVSNKQIREFLLIESQDVAKKLLFRLNLPTSGANKNRLYHRPQDITKLDT